jgi:hypothetical protein
MRSIHMSGLFGGSGRRRRTWCGRLVDDDQLPIIGTRREANCIACARTTQARLHAILWDYDYQTRWRALLREEGE